MELKILKVNYGINPLNLDGSNLESYYKVEYLKWLISQSDDVSIGDIKGDEAKIKIALLFLAAYELKSTDELKGIKFSGKKGGIYLTEKMFIDFQKKKYQPLLEYLSERTINEKAPLQVRFESKANLYLEYLNKLNQPTANKHQQENLYPRKMFDGYTGYKIWQRFFEDLKVTESSLTDISFLFEQMKKDKYIHDIFSLANLYEWLNEEYEYAVGRIKYTDPNSDANKKRMSVYYSIKENIKHA